MTSPNRLNPPKWSQVEAGYYTRRIGSRRLLEVVHLDHTPADRLNDKRWVVRVAEFPKLSEKLGRFATKREAMAFADEWRRTHIDSSGAQP